MNNYNQSEKLDCTKTAPFFKKNSLSSRVASIMLAGAALSSLPISSVYAQQQEEQDAQSEAAALEEVVITGIRQCSGSKARSRHHDGLLGG